MSKQDIFRCTFNPSSSTCLRNTLPSMFHSKSLARAFTSPKRRACRFIFSWRCDFVSLRGQTELTASRVDTWERNQNIWMLPCGRMKIDVSQNMFFFPPYILVQSNGAMFSHLPLFYYLMKIIYILNVRILQLSWLEISPRCCAAAPPVVVSV